MDDEKKQIGVPDPLSVAGFAERWDSLPELLALPLSLEEWVSKLNDPKSGAAELLLSQFLDMSMEVSLCNGVFNDVPLPGPESASRYRTIADLLATWLDAGSSIDPSPLLEASAARDGLGESLDPVPLGVNVPEEAWRDWEAAHRRIAPTLRRAQLWLVCKGGGRLEDVDAKQQPTEPKPETAINSKLKEAAAIGLLLMSDGDLQKAEIAKRLGYAHQSGLRRFDAFDFWFRHREIALKLVSELKAMDQKSGHAPASTVDKYGVAVNENDPDDDLD